MFRHSSKSDPVSEGTPSAATRRHNLSPLRRLFPFLWPYRLQILGAVLALTVAAGTVLGLGQGMRVLVDQGFVAGDSALLDRALLVLLAVIVLMAASTFGRFYLVSWIGERVVADTSSTRPGRTAGDCPVTVAVTVPDDRVIVTSGSVTDRDPRLVRICSARA